MAPASWPHTAGCLVSGRPHACHVVVLNLRRAHAGGLASGVSTKLGIVFWHGSGRLDGPRGLVLDYGAVVRGIGVVVEEREAPGLLGE